jgi:hypothetical protein
MSSAPSSVPVCGNLCTQYGCTVIRIAMCAGTRTHNRSRTLRAPALQTLLESPVGAPLQLNATFCAVECCVPVHTRAVRFFYSGTFLLCIVVVLINKH